MAPSFVLVLQDDSPPSHLQARSNAPTKTSPDPLQLEIPGGQVTERPTK